MSDATFVLAVLGTVEVVLLALISARLRMHEMARPPKRKRRRTARKKDG